MNLYQNAQYCEEIKNIAKRFGETNQLRGKTIVLSGATGMIGSLIVDILLYGNLYCDYQCKIGAIVRSLDKAENRFSNMGKAQGLYLIQADINEPLDQEKFDNLGQIDYVIHAASNTHPVAYATDPVNTILTNVIGTNHLLQLATAMHVERFLFLSSVEIYGENRGDVDLFDEFYCGYLDSNSLRAGYPEGKRAGEALCQAYRKQHQLDVVIVRLARTYGPTLLKSDTKAMSQFLWNALEGKPVVLKSEGTQKFSYLYAADAAEGILWLLKNGTCGDAYNLAGKESNVELRKLASTIAESVGTEVVFDLPSDTERAGFSKATKAMLDTKKIESIGFEAKFDLKRGIAQTINILRNNKAE